MMGQVLYDIATTCAAPLGAAYLALSSRHRDLLARFSPPVPAFTESPIWLHACSVGEVGVAKPLLAALRIQFPKLPLFLTCSTISGHKRAKETISDVPIGWFPFDQHAVVKRFFNGLRPRLLVLIETELWPNVVKEASRVSVPVALVNARISEKHFSRYQRHAWLLRPIFERIAVVGAQNDEYAARLKALGVEPTRIHVTGNTKFDELTSSIDSAVTAKLREECGISSEAPVLVFGSTRPGDEQLAADCWRSLRDEFPNAKLIVAPRHVKRRDEATAPFDEPLLLRSESHPARGERVIILDTVGELISFYGIATAAVIGGSFFPGVNGHNPLEPAALGVPTVFGPYMSNFPDPARALLDADGAIQITNEKELLPTLRKLLLNAQLRESIARRGREAIARNQGALQRTVDLIASLLPPTPSPK